MSYSRNFGMRSFENIVRDGRFRTPAGSSFVIGSPVTLDPANPGFLKQAAAGAAPGASAGVVVFEHIQAIGVDPVLSTYADQIFDKVPGGRYAQMIHGAGCKVWFRNNAGRALYDGRPVNAAGLLDSGLDLTGVKPGDGLAPIANGKYGAAGSTGRWLTVEQVNPSTGLVEARFEF